MKRPTIRAALCIAVLMAALASAACNPNPQPPPGSNPSGQSG